VFSQNRARSKRDAIAGVFVCLLSAAPAAGQTAPEPKPQMAEEAFKNIQVLKGIPVNEFMSTMGVFSAALGMSCEDCHAANDSSWENYALDTSERKRTARRMIVMMSAINKAYFGGRQVVTCYSCHRGSDHPKVTASLANLYGGGPPEEPDEVIAQASDAPPADQVLDKYIQALGGAQRLAAVTSFAAKGTSSGYGPEGEKRPVEIYAQTPGRRTTVIHTDNGDSTTACDGRACWIAAPLRPVAVVPVTGEELDGAKIDAELSFPLRIKQALGRWRVGRPSMIGDRDVQVVQGTGAGGALATFYFDAESGLLVRLMRYAGSPVGRIPVQIDYSDYREVSGVKMPFKWTVTWLDGRENFELSEVRTNVPMDQAKFAKPAPPVAPPKRPAAR
jgi:photosynthetic reaction center cytochrome c subunit